MVSPDLVLAQDGVQIPPLSALSYATAWVTISPLGGPDSSRR
jgi:hypothetical protein